MATPLSVPSNFVEENDKNLRDVDSRSLESAGEEYTEGSAFARRTIWKVDWRLLPILSGLYTFALVDRGNLAVARLAGADKALHLSIDNRYSIVALVFFVPYILLELPSNVILRRVGPKVWLTFISMSWGASQIGMGFAKSWKTIALCRVLIGAFEAGFFAACVYLISVWYVRREVQTRLAGFYLTALFVGGFANILTYGFSKMDGLAGLAGWQWIFIMCGITTCALALIAYPLICDFPDQNTFLTPTQTSFMRSRVQADRGDATPDPLTLPKCLAYARDPKIYIFAYLYLSSSTPAYAFAYFLPNILLGMGYSIKMVFLLTAPPYASAAISTFLFARLGDKLNLRAPLIAVQALIVIIGLSMTGFAHSNAVRYAGVFLGMAGSQGNIPATLAYSANNIVGQSKRAFTSAIVVGSGGIGGIIATTVFRQVDAPKYIPGIWTTIGLQIGILVVVGLSSMCFARENRRVRAARAGGDGGRLIEGQEGFFYTL